MIVINKDFLDRGFNNLHICPRYNEQILYGKEIKYPKNREILLNLLIHGHKYNLIEPGQEERVLEIIKSIKNIIQKG
jgi:hypothetical protein